MKKLLGYWVIGLLGFVICTATVQAITNDTYFEDFDGFEENATIDGVNHWSVDQGVTTNAITQDTQTVTGTGNALELVGDTTTVNVSRPEKIGDLSPCWIEFYVKPGMGSETPSVPTGKAAAVTFDYTGKVYASNGSSWVDTEKTFTAGQWYRVLLKLDFSEHLYDIYIFPADIPETEFIPAKENLTFIDTTIDSLSDLGFKGVYNAGTQDDNTYIDNLLVNFIKKLQIITPAQRLTVDEVSSQIIVQLQNDASEPQTAWEDIVLQLSSESTGGEFSLDKTDWSPVSQVTIPEDGFQAVFYYKDEKEGSPIIKVKEYPEMGWEEALQQQTIIAEVDYFDISLTTPQIAGQFFTITITAKDEDGDVNEDYTGSVEIRARYISPDTGTMNITPDTASGFEEGVLEKQVAYPDCGTIEIEIIDTGDADKTGRSGAVLFIPASFSVTCDEAEIVNKSFALEVATYNAQGNITPNYKGPAGLDAVLVSPEEVSGARFSPATITGENFEDGTAKLDVSYNRWGGIKMEVKDSGYPSQKGLSDIIQFYPKSIKIDVEPPPSGRTFFYTGENIEITISVLDEEDAPIVNYAGTVTISPTSGLDMPHIYEFLESDEGAHTFTLSCASPGTYFVSTEEPSGKEAESQAIEVKQATIVVISTEAPVGSTEVTIIITDEEGNIISSENELPVSITLEEENPDGSALSPAILKPIIFHNGVSRIIITDPEAEIVTITPKSRYKFNIKKGTVTFGRIAKKGLGTVMWREIKE